MKILSIDNFNTKLLSKFLMIFIMGSICKVIRFLIVKLVIDNFFIERLFFHMKTFSIINFTTKPLSIKDYFFSWNLRKLIKKVNYTGVEWVEISQKIFARFFGPRTFVRS